MRNNVEAKSVTKNKEEMSRVLKEGYKILSLRVFGLLSSFLLLFPQRFGWYGVTVIGVFFPKLLRRQSSGGFRFNHDCRQVTIQEYLTLVPGYG